MFGLTWKIRCIACDTLYSRHRARCPVCQRKKPPVFGKIVKILLVLIALAGTIYLWVEVLRKSGWWSAP